MIKCTIFTTCTLATCRILYSEIIINISSFNLINEEIVHKNNVIRKYLKSFKICNKSTYPDIVFHVDLPSPLFTLNSNKIYFKILIFNLLQDSTTVSY